MASLIWLDEQEDSLFYNRLAPLWLIRSGGNSIATVVFNNRHILAKGNILEGRIGK